jgi:hypothetical protein
MYKFTTIANLFWDTENTVMEYFYSGIGNGYRVQCGQKIYYESNSQHRLLYSLSWLTTGI